MKVTGSHRHHSPSGATLPDDTTDQGWGLLTGQNRGPQPGHLRILFHGHGHGLFRRFLEETESQIARGVMQQNGLSNRASVHHHPPENPVPDPLPDPLLTVRKSCCDGTTSRRPALLSLRDRPHIGGSARSGRREGCEHGAVWQHRRPRRVTRRCSGLWRFLVVRTKGRVAVELEQERNRATAEVIRLLPENCELLEYEPAGGSGLSVGWGRPCRHRQRPGTCCCLARVSGLADEPRRGVRRGSRCSVPHMETSACGAGDERHPQGVG